MRLVARESCKSLSFSSSSSGNRVFRVLGSGNGVLGKVAEEEGGDLELCLRRQEDIVVGMGFGQRSRDGCGGWR